LYFIPPKLVPVFYSVIKHGYRCFYFNFIIKNYPCVLKQETVLRGLVLDGDLHKQSSLFHNQT